MHTRLFGQRHISEIGLGAWQLGGADWGDMPETKAFEILEAAADCGVTFIDTADVYGLGRSEELIGLWLQTRTDRDDLFIATKLGRFPEPGWPGNFTAAAVRTHVEASLSRLGVDALDLVQTHCVPLEALQTGEMFETLSALKRDGKIKAFGASVETIEQARAAMAYDDLASLQVIFNILRQPMAEEVFPEAKRRGVAIIVRLPLASGLLSGRFDESATFAANDHRTYNRDGAAFYVGETFAGLPLAKGAELAARVREFMPLDMVMSEFALRWCLDHDAVTTVIPGASKPTQARANAQASDIPPLDADLHARLWSFYEANIAHHIRGGV